MRTDTGSVNVSYYGDGSVMSEEGIVSFRG